MYFQVEDGYTLTLGSLSTHVLNGAFYSLKYDVLNDFAPVSPLVTTPALLFAKKTMPAENLDELVNAAAGFISDAQQDDTSLTAFLAHAALEAGDNQAQAGADALQLMTVHSAKGLEFQRLLGHLPALLRLEIPFDRCRAVGFNTTREFDRVEQVGTSC